MIKILLALFTPTRNINPATVPATDSVWVNEVAAASLGIKPGMAHPTWLASVRAERESPRWF